MELFHAFIVFLFVLFCYSQLAFQLKKGDDLTLYEIDYTTNDELNTSANLKQPFLFLFSHIQPGFTSTPMLGFQSMSTLVEKHGNFDVILKETADYYTNSTAKTNQVTLTINAVNTLMNSDSKSEYFSWNNMRFISETGLYKEFKACDALLKTPLCAVNKYDIVFGSAGATTPLLYHTNERRYLYVQGGKITVKITPWRSHKYMVINKDYANYEFTSPLNVWLPQEQYFTGYNKIKFLNDVIVPAGHMLYIPPYWFYSIMFEKDNHETVVYQFDYGSVMNVGANLANLTQHMYAKMGPKPITTDPAAAVL